MLPCQQNCCAVLLVWEADAKLFFFFNGATVDRLEEGQLGAKRKWEKRLEGEIDNESWD